MAQENETILELGVESQIKFRFVHLDPPGLIGPGRLRNLVYCALSGSLHLSTFDNDPESDVFPQCYQQLSC